MRNNERDVLSRTEEQLQRMLEICSEYLSSAAIRGVQHNIDHSEYENAFESLFLNLMSLEKQVMPLDAEECKALGHLLELDRESVVDIEFWDKFTQFISSAG